jgi:hypothetical protein
MEIFSLVFSMKIIIILHHSRLSLEVERPGREANYSHASSAVAKIEWSCASTPSYVFKTRTETALTFKSRWLVYSTCKNSAFSTHIVQNVRHVILRISSMDSMKRLFSVRIIRNP